MYNSFSVDYDRFVNWASRLAVELPFLQQQIRLVSPVDRDGIYVLDAACGTGMHAIALAKLGYKAAGADLSVGMIQKAYLNAQDVGVEVRFEAVGFGELTKAFGRQSFDVLLCLGNSLPHLLTASELAAALSDFAACLRPGGLILIQNRNFDAVLDCRERWMEPQSHREGDEERVFLRFYDFRPDGLLGFNVLTLHRQGRAPWTQGVAEALLRPLRQVELAQALAAAGFGDLTWYGDMTGSPFDAHTSGNLVVSARI
jgi:SAM-dependent methyltransferase